MSILITTLGAGSEVGRSCFLISIEGVTVLVDAGVHMNPASKEERIPKIPKAMDISAVIITHYHMDHVGALPHLTHVSKSIPSDVEILMTSPTKTLSPLVCLDYSRGPNGDLYVPNHVHKCFMNSEIRIIGCNEEVRLRKVPDFIVHAVYAGHVVGGVMLFLSYRGRCVVYSGDFSVTSTDSLLDPIFIPPRLIPREGADVLISECTHATTVAPKQTVAPESVVCERIKKALTRGGSVLIPVFAVGRTQEFASMIRQYLGPQVRIFTTSPAGQRASVLTASLHRQWIKEDIVPVDLNVHVLGESDPFPPNSVVFASPAMIEGGASLRLFSQICDDARNLVLLTGYCTKGTVGNSVILFASRPGTKDRWVNVSNNRREVRCECMYSPFTNHTDSNGIVQVLRELRPRTGVVLVHGEKDKIERFRNRIITEGVVDNSVNVVIPSNYETHIFDPPARTTDVRFQAEGSVRLKYKIPIRADITMEMIRDNLVSRLTDISVRMEEHESLKLWDKRAMVRVTKSADNGEVICKWEGDRSLGPDWIMFNPLVNSLKYALTQAGLLGSHQDNYPVQMNDKEDTLSVSACSE